MRELKRIEKNLLKVIDFTLTEAASGVKRLTPAEIRALSDVISANRPPVYHIQNVLINQFGFLAEFDADESERAAISRFLTAFREQAAADLMGKNATLQAGLSLQVPHDR